MGLIGDLLEAKVKKPRFWAGASAVSSIADARPSGPPKINQIQVLGLRKVLLIAFGKDYQEISEKFRAYGFTAMYAF